MQDNDKLADDLVNLLAETGDLSAGDGLLKGVSQMQDEGYTEEEIRNAIIHVSSDDDPVEAGVAVGREHAERVYLERLDHVADEVYADAMEREVTELSEAYHIPKATVRGAIVATAEHDESQRKLSGWRF